MEPIRAALSNTRVHIVSKDSTPSGFEEALNLCDVKHLRFDTCEELEAKIATSGVEYPKSVFICMIHEDKFCLDAYHRVTKMTKSALLTMGPKRSVKTSLHHIRDPLQTFPSVLLQAIMDQVTKMNNLSTEESDVTVADNSTSLSNDFSPEAPLMSRSRTFSASSLCPPTETLSLFDVQGISKASKTPSYTHLRVLIAEDNVVNQKILHRTLVRLGLKHIDIVDNGKKAVDHSLVKQYDLVLMDMQMPVMDGLEATRIIVDRRSQEMSSLPRVVLVTAHVMETFQAEIKSSGVDGFVAKPFNLQRIDEMLQSLSQFHHEPCPAAHDGRPLP
jgi:CheY-like chemotaxis protein